MAQPPIFGQCPLWPNGWMDQDGTWHGGRPQRRRHCVTWGPSSPFPKRALPLPNFRPISTVAKRLNGSGWHLPWRLAFVRPHCTIWDLAPLLQKGAEPPIFGPSLLWPHGWMHQDAIWYGGRPQARRLCVRWGQSPPSKKGAKSPPVFGPRLL